MSRSEKAMQAVRETLDANPDAETQELFERAKEADASIEDLSLRQFNARYPLQVKRQMSAGGDGSGLEDQEEPSSHETKKMASQREAIRKGMLRFAHDVARAEGKAQLIDVFTAVDAYVDKIVEALDL